MGAKSQRKPISDIFYENRSRIVVAVLVLLDIFTLSLAAFVSVAVRLLLVPWLGGDISWPLIFNSLLFYITFNVLVAWSLGLYPGFGLSVVIEMQKVIHTVTLAIIFLGVFLFLQQLGLAYSRLIFALTWFLSTLFMMLGRFALRNRLSLRTWWGIPMVIIGTTHSAKPTIEKLIQNRRLGYRPVAHFDLFHNASTSLFGIPSIESKEQLQQLSDKAGIQHVIFTDPIEERMTAEFDWIQEAFPNVLFVLNIAPFSSLWVRTIDLHGSLVVETHYHLLNHRERVIKRILDFVLTVMILLISWPVFLILTVLIKLTTKGSVLYTQKRLGKDGRIFESYKFRTMYPNAEEKLVELLQSDADAAREYALYHKLTDDPRITPIGRFLRRYSLDELPQLINVIRGDMNLIGPRSYLPRESDAMGEHARIIHKVRPGITGWWQVMGRNATSFEERLQLDEYYISNWSIWLDIYIVIKTGWVLISGKGL